MSHPRWLRGAQLQNACASGHWILALASIVLLFLFSDLKGISNDEGLRLLALNGNKPFSGERQGFDASWDALRTALSTTNYQPLYYIIQKFVTNVSKSRDLILLKSINIFTIFLCMFVTFKITSTWPIAARWYMIFTTYFSGYLFMHVLQVREYSLGILFLALLYAITHFLLLRQREQVRRTDMALYAGYGLFAGVASLNSFWILPAWAGAALALLGLSQRRLAIGRRLSVAVLSFLAVLAVLHFVQGLDKKVDVGAWDTRDLSYRRLGWLSFRALSYAVTGSQVPDAWQWLGLVEAACALAVVIGALIFAISLAVGGRRRPTAWDSLQVHALLSAAMIVSLCTFQLAYALIRRDALPLWERYFFQHFWLLHVLLASMVGLLSGSFGNRQSPGRAWLQGSALAVLVACGMAWSAKGLRGYYVDPYADTGMRGSCEWRILAPRVRDAAQGDPIVFSRLLEAGTLTFSARFGNRLMVWGGMPKDSAEWPSSLVLVDVRGRSAPQEIQGRNTALAAAGFHQTDERAVPGGSEGCHLIATVTRFARAP